MALNEANERYGFLLVPPSNEFEVWVMVFRDDGEHGAGNTESWIAFQESKGNVLIEDEEKIPAYLRQNDSIEIMTIWGRGTNFLFDRLNNMISTSNAWIISDFGACFPVKEIKNSEHLKKQLFDNQITLYA